MPNPGLHATERVPPERRSGSLVPLRLAARIVHARLHGAEAAGLRELDGMAGAITALVPVYAKPGEGGLYVSRTGIEHVIGLLGTAP